MVKEKHYKITKSDFDKMKNGKEIFLYNGSEVKIYLSFPLELVEED